MLERVLERRVTTLLMTNSMNQDPSSRTGSRKPLPFLAPVFKSLSYDRILSQFNPVHTLTPYLFKNPFILILSSCLRRGLKSGLFPSNFPFKFLYKLTASPCVIYVPTPSSFSSSHVVKTSNCRWPAMASCSYIVS
jgi:hypothetical protein